jgi:hypothetical protein
MRIIFPSRSHLSPGEAQKNVFQVWLLGAQVAEGDLLRR